MSSVGKLLVEATVVGISLVIIGAVVMFLLKLTPLHQSCANCDRKVWDKYYIAEISLFLTGFLGHLLFEVTGINKWYIKNSNASKSN